jgi:RNA polymerase sigma-70 factor (ECF subfamily)
MVRRLRDSPRFPPPTTVPAVSEKPLTSDQFVVLIARHERRVRSFIVSLAASSADAVDEVLQATYLVAWQKLHTFSYVEATPDEELVRWMCTIARFELMSYSRRYGSSRLAFDDALISQIADVHAENSDYLESRHQALRGCIERLPTRQREMLGQRYWRGESVQELASSRGQEVNAVYTALSRIRKGLERCIRQSMRQEGYPS